MDNKELFFLGSDYQNKIHPIEKAMKFWVDNNPKYQKFFTEGKLIPPIIKSAIHCVKDKAFLEDQSDSFIYGLVIFSKGLKNNDLKKMEKGEAHLKPMLDKIISYLSSERFKKFVLAQHVTGEERLPISVPEIFITVNELYLLSNRGNSIIITENDVNDLKQNFVSDKIRSWDLDGEFGEKMKNIESLVYPSIFNPPGFLIFNNIMKDQKKEGRGVQTDIVFFYHKLKEKGFIHAKVEKFKLWFESQYPLFPIIERFHSLERISEINSRKERLSKALHSITSK